MRRAESGQAAILLVGAALALLLSLGLFAAFGKAMLGKGRYQRAADLAAVSAARSMRDDFDRLFEPAVDKWGRPNPAHLEKSRYLARARRVAVAAARLNGAPLEERAVEFPDSASFAPVRVRVRLSGLLSLQLGPGDARRVFASASAEAELGATDVEGSEGWEGGYRGPFAYRQGKPMRPDVALAFDRVSAAARHDGITLLISSAYRSDAEQARLYARHPDPRWVAPPGHSLHRNATELDLGPPSSYAWLAAHARRFGFIQRYAWERWH